MSDPSTQPSASGPLNPHISTIGSRIGSRYRAELPTILISLVVLAAVWYFTRLYLPLVGGILACILAAPLFPHKFAWVASLLGYGGLAALCYFKYNNTQFAMLLAAAGIIFAASSYFSKGRV